MGFRGGFGKGGLEVGWWWPERMNLLGSKGGDEGWNTEENFWGFVRGEFLA